MIATNRSWPVSTTYSIISAVAGVGVALAGPNSVNWGWNGGKGLATIFAGFFVGMSSANSIAICILTVPRSPWNSRRIRRCCLPLDKVSSPQAK